MVDHSSCRAVLGSVLCYLWVVITLHNSQPLTHAVLMMKCVCVPSLSAILFSRGAPLPAIKSNYFGHKTVFDLPFRSFDFFLHVFILLFMVDALLTVSYFSCFFPMHCVFCFFYPFICCISQTPLLAQKAWTLLFKMCVTVSLLAPQC